MGDIEGGIALLKLGRLYERTNEADQAAAAYTQGKTYCRCYSSTIVLKETEGQGIPDRDDQGQAYKFLGNYHLRLDQLTQVPGTGFLKVKVKMLNSKNEKLDFL